ncbi:hypothetical protein PtA15_9A352 [Puccinia triticina]|uniref:Uncharacterized protein n=1 Tax=Puccinia triticina TaxID=208348 RepID=A0ABY7CT98_9BASI|nr:uncharacterized protein PtA15_9A352 [Puccinia triticina]WAQ88225.1 hypothetical protein PtA15_9A352 [Puccinia triticina]
MAQCRLIRSTPTTPAPATNAFAPCTRVTNTSPISSFTATSEHSWALNLLPHHLLHQLLLASRPKQLLTRAYRATPIVARVSTTDQFVAQTQHQLSKSSAKRNILPNPSLFEDDQAHGSLSLVSFVVPPQPDAKLLGLLATSSVVRSALRALQMNSVSADLVDESPALVTNAWPV